MAKIVHIFRAPKKHMPMEELEEVRVIPNVGLEGCAHARPGGSRQVLLMDREMLREMDLEPGIIRENITTDGIDVNGLRAGEELRIGETVLKVTTVCEPCNQLEKIRRGLMHEMWGRRGMLCRVVQGGVIRRGDAIEKVAAEKTLPLVEASGNGPAAE